MEDQAYRRADGSCIISEDVIATIASSAATEVPGVAGMAQKPADIRGIIGSAAARAVRVLNNDNETVLDVYIQLKPGARIPEVAVQSMTGKPVTKVNVHVAGLSLEDDKSK